MKGNVAAEKPPVAWDGAFGLIQNQKGDSEMKTMVRTGKMRNMTASALVVSLGLFFLAASTPAEDLQEIIVITGQRIAGFPSDA